MRDGPCTVHRGLVMLLKLWQSNCCELRLRFKTPALPSRMAQERLPCSAQGKGAARGLEAPLWGNSPFIAQRWSPVKKPLTQYNVFSYYYTMTKAFLYLRTSGDDRQDKAGIPVQRTDCTAFADRAGYEI